MIIMQWLKRDKKVLAAAVVLGLIFTAGFTLYTKDYSNKMQSGISDGFIRFHVLANSNSAEDQTLKLAVRDAILEEYREGLETAADKGATRAYLSENLGSIKVSAEKVISENGYDYNAAVSISNDFFPTKAYGDIRLPAGEYETLRVVIGEGDGNNWWCVMFPPLCYVDITKKTLPEESKAEVKNLLSDKEYELVSMTEETENVSVKIKFKVVEWWQERQANKEKDKPVGRYVRIVDEDGAAEIEQ